MDKCEQCIIRQFNSLKALTRDELVRISDCKTFKTIKKGEVLFEEGQRIDGVYCIKKGVCKLSKISDNGRDQIVHLVKRGDLLGERSLINNEVSNLKATALNEMQVCFIPKVEIINDLKKNPNFTMDVLKNMALSLKASDNVIVDMAQKTVKQRLALMLLYLEEKFQFRENGSLNIYLSREDVASIIGTATESAIRLLAEFKKKELINLKGKEIFLLNKTSLKQISEGL